MAIELGSTVGRTKCPKATEPSRLYYRRLGLRHEGPAPLLHILAVGAPQPGCGGVQQPFIRARSQRVEERVAYGIAPVGTKQA